MTDTHSPTLDARIPEGPIQQRWDQHKFDVHLVNPANKRKYDIIVVGTGLAGASAAATFGELGYNVEVFTYHDSARRAHSIAAQGGINAAKNYPNDGDSIARSTPGARQANSSCWAPIRRWRARSMREPSSSTTERKCSMS